MEDPRQSRSGTPGHPSHLGRNPSPRGVSPFQPAIHIDTVANTTRHPINGHFETSASYMTMGQSQHGALAQNYAQQTLLQSNDSLGIDVTQQPDFFSGNPLTYGDGLDTTSHFDAQFFPTGSETMNHSIDPSIIMDPQLMGLQQNEVSPVGSARLVTGIELLAAQHFRSPPTPTLQNSLFTDVATPPGPLATLQNPFQTPSHSRNTSLDPSSAAFPSGQGGDWALGTAFRGHRRAASDTYSDVSSAKTSPFVGNTESYEGPEHISPSLAAQTDPALFPEVMQFGQFSISDIQPPPISPGQSPQVSPRVPPGQQTVGSFILPSNDDAAYPAFSNPLQHSLSVDTGIQQAGRHPPQHRSNSSIQMGQADQTLPPEINIQLVPPSRQSTFEPMSMDDALHPTNRNKKINRNRASSDPFAALSSRPTTPASSGHDSPIPDPLAYSVTPPDPGSLSPHDAVSPPTRRPPVPGNKAARRLSTSALPTRGYAFDISGNYTPPEASPPSGAESGSGSRRTQKHPATFQCQICPKRFTRAYNLRSHLRTHTDERPFVCSVCGKAFARQHDRKRHEGLHTGEKKFVCRGTLKDGGSWGCNRRFARADALCRHFKSEAGRVCIRPLLDEESAAQSEKRQQQSAAFLQQQPEWAQAGAMGSTAPGMLSSTGPLNSMPGFDADPGASSSLNDPLAGQMPLHLPAALLAQIPALAAVQWDTLPPGPPPDEFEGDISGRSSFDASSGGEWMDEDDDNLMSSNLYRHRHSTGDFPVT